MLVYEVPSTVWICDTLYEDITASPKSVHFHLHFPLPHSQDPTFSPQADLPGLSLSLAEIRQLPAEIRQMIGIYLRLKSSFL